MMIEGFDTLKIDVSIANKFSELVNIPVELLPEERTAREWENLFL